MIFSVTLELSLQADDAEEARELAGEAVALLATSVAVGPSVLAVAAHAPREKLTGVLA